MCGRAASGRAVVVRGEPGLGKSRIVAALRERLHDQSSYTLLLQCSPFFVNSAFYPIRTWFERTLEFGRDERADSRLDKLEALVVDRLGLPKDDLRFVAAMLSIPYQDRYGAILISPKLAKEDTMRVLVDIVRAAARTQPTLLLFEDAHLADPTTLDVLSRLVDRLVDVPTLMVVTARPEFKSPWSDRAGCLDDRVDQVHAGAEPFADRQARRPQSAAGRPRRSDRRANRRRAAVRRGADQEHPGIGRPGR